MPFYAKNALIALLITAAIIGTILYAINVLNQERIKELRGIEDQLATDTLSIETQFALLQEAPCEDLPEDILSQELGNLGDRLAFAEERLGATDPEVLRLKERYTLLQIRDYLLIKRLERSCDLDPVITLYFYSNVPGECESCDRAGYALSYLRQTYPALRVYSFDYNLDLAALKTFVAVENVKKEFPAFVIQDKPTYGFTTLEEFEELFPEEMFESASSTATTTADR
jgi:hypothetical protein